MGDWGKSVLHMMMYANLFTHIPNTDYTHLWKNYVQVHVSDNDLGNYDHYPSYQALQTRW